MKTTLFFGHEIADKIHARTRTTDRPARSPPPLARCCLDLGSAPMKALCRAPEAGGRSPGHRSSSWKKNAAENADVLLQLERPSPR